MKVSDWFLIGAAVILCGVLTILWLECANTRTCRTCRDRTNEEEDTYPYFSPFASHIHVLEIVNDSALKEDIAHDRHILVESNKI
jgi:hypothetical protein